MALIACPDCKKEVSDSADTCPHCHCPVATKLLRMQEEEEARRAQEWREKEQQFTFGALVVIALVLLVIIGSCVSRQQQQEEAALERIAVSLDHQTANLSAGHHAFSTVGRVRIDFSCHPNTTSAASVLFFLVDTKSSAAIWKKQGSCPASDYATTQVNQGQYDVGVTMTAKATWSMKVTLNPPYSL